MSDAALVVTKPGSEVVRTTPSLPKQGAIDWTESLLRWFALLPFTARRLLLATIFRLAAPLLLADPPAKLVTACSRTLSLSRRDSVRFLKRSLMFNSLFQMEWLSLAYRCKAGLVRDTLHVMLDRTAEIEWLTAQRGAILGTMHFGPYSLGLVWLLHRHFTGRTVIIVKTRSEDADEQAAIARLNDLGVDLRFIAPDSDKGQYEIAKQLRRGAFAVVMVDLPPTYGRSAASEMLGRTLHFANGAVELAALCGVPLVLFRTRTEIVRDWVEIADIFEVRRGDEKSRDRATRRVHRFIMRTVTSWPHQWHMWPRFHQYLRSGDAA